MPLADGPWERGKCGYKLVQYMACGLATVASPVGANLQILRDGVDGILADGVPDWRAAVERLVADPALRASCGRAGRAHVEESYSLQCVLPRLAAALSDAATSRIGRP
jgi:glycosyltransferase involved in cell wall biosynthesis